MIHFLDTGYCKRSFTNLSVQLAWKVTCMQPSLPPPTTNPQPHAPKKQNVVPMYGKCHGWCLVGFFLTWGMVRMLITAMKTEISMIYKYFFNMLN